LNISDTQFSFQNEAHPIKDSQKFYRMISHTVKPERQNPERQTVLSRLNNTTKNEKWQERKHTQNHVSITITSERDRSPIDPIPLHGSG
jgi:hypothetical protein